MSSSNIMKCLLIFFLVFLSSCFKKNKVLNKPVVKVNDNILTAKEFSERLGNYLKQLDSVAAKDPVVTQRAKNEITNAFVVQSLMLDWSKEKKIEISNDEIESEVNKIRKFYPDDLSFRKALAEENVSFSGWYEKVKFNLLEKKVSEEINKKIKDPTEEEMKSFYAENKDSFKLKERIFIHQIVVKDEARAEFIKTELKKTAFVDLAKKYSLGPESTKGGVVGWIEKGSVDFYDPLFKWPLNTVGEIVKTPFGYLVAKVEKREPEAIPSFSLTKDKIKRRIIELKEKAEYVSWMDIQLRSSKVYKDLDFINSIKIETQGQKDE